MKDIILKYKKINPKVGYIVLSKIFGLPIDDLIQIFWDGDYEIDKEDYKYMNITSNNFKNRKIYSECIQTNRWEEKHFNIWNKLEYFSNEKGYWEKRSYDDYGSEIYFETSEGQWTKTYYNDMGIKVGGEDSKYGKYTIHYIGTWSYKEFL